MTPLLAVEGLEKIYESPTGPKVALKGVSFSVSPGEIVGVIGPNGAGKTTTLSILAGITRATAGTLNFREDINATRHRIACIGFSPQIPAFHSFFSAKDELAHWGALAGVPMGELPTRVQAVLSRVDLADRSLDGLETFSRGMLQRLSLAQALLHQPPILLLDEPTSSLDPVAQSRALKILQEERDAGRAVIVSSHNLTEVASACDRVVFMRSGEIVEVISTHAPKELFWIEVSCRRAPAGIAEFIVRQVPIDGGVRFTVSAAAKRRLLAVLAVDADVEVLSICEARVDLHETYRKHFNE